MRNFVLKNTTEYRVETVNEIVKFRDELQKQAAQDGYSLSAFGYSEKLVKEKGEVVDSYYIVRATFTINDAKEPTIPIFSVNLPYSAEEMLTDEEVDFD